MARSLLQVATVPLDHSLEAILNVAWLTKAVILVRVDDQLRRNIQTPQRLVHLLRVDQGHVDVFLAAHEQCRCLDAISVQEREGNFRVRLD